MDGRMSYLCEHSQHSKCLKNESRSPSGHSSQLFDYDSQSTLLDSDRKLDSYRDLTVRRWRKPSSLARIFKIDLPARYQDLQCLTYLIP